MDPSNRHSMGLAIMSHTVHTQYSMPYSGTIHHQKDGYGMIRGQLGQPGSESCLQSNQTPNPQLQQPGYTVASCCTPDSRTLQPVDVAVSVVAVAPAGIVAAINQLIIFQVLYPGPMKKAKLPQWGPHHYPTTVTRRHLTSAVSKPPAGVQADPVTQAE